jgi:hypothetical protein
MKKQTKEKKTAKTPTKAVAKKISKKDLGKISGGGLKGW